MYEQKTGDLFFSNDKTKLQMEVIYSFLSIESYWAKNIPFKTVEDSIKNSLCFGVYVKNQQIGFGRVITDYATFGYLADVFIIEPYRGKGVSKKLIDFIMNYQDLTKLLRFMLATKDGHGLYKKYGFNELSTPERFMEIKPFETYTS